MAKKILLSFLVVSVLVLGSAAVFEKGLFLSAYQSRLKLKEEEKAIRDTIRLYNKIMTDIYVSDGIPARLNDFPATKQIRHELFKHIGYLREKGLILIYDMADMHVKEIKMSSPLAAEAIVFEEWNYIYRKNPSRELASSIKGLGQGFKYLLSKQDNKWIVVNYVPIEIEIDKKDEFLF